jgi:hypothetical protein
MRFPLLALIAHFAFVECVGNYNLRLRNYNLDSGNEFYNRLISSWYLELTEKQDVRRGTRDSNIKDKKPRGVFNFHHDNNENTFTITMTDVSKPLLDRYLDCIELAITAHNKRYEQDQKSLISIVT